MRSEASSVCSHIPHIVNLTAYDHIETDILTFRYCKPTFHCFGSWQQPAEHVHQHTASDSDLMWLDLVAGDPLAPAALGAELPELPDLAASAQLQPAKIAVLLSGPALPITDLPRATVPDDAPGADLASPPKLDDVLIFSAAPSLASLTLNSDELLWLPVPAIVGTPACKPEAEPAVSTFD